MRLSLLLAVLMLPLAALADTQPFSPEQTGGAKVIYVDFWASWCGPCRRSFPWLNDMQKQYGDKGFTVIGVNLDPKRADADKFLDAYPASFPLVFDPDGEYAEQYHLKGMPSAVLIDANGKILARHVGFHEEKKSEYEQQIISLLEAQQ
ncbi:thioredoxin [Alcanivorax hongdengensis A-11-3]|uniref:Thioredoxin n=1 Tax=Alcanivorax hongdengensis A-11-3 TaxID=1177179 RepID=L0WAX0_9GAMM|nr:TlpA disulfide reductase family protein [Alcanivorax hongdengensis]EKF72870.1 thioredoxin [Alcanivorax hongdengensis A-11-3]